MTSSTDRPLLRLVHDRGTSARADNRSGHFEPIQTSLLHSGQRTLFVCTTDSIDEHFFVKAITELRPRFAIDLRATPRFDFGSLNRRRVLSLFEALNVEYLDLACESRSTAALTKAISNISKTQFTEDLNKELHAAVLFVFIDPTPDYRAIGLELVNHFRSLTEFDWELVLYGPEERSTAKREVIFLSHANPEDNEFALWLHAQLTRHGYKVWSDLTDLGGGETFWDAIEAVIRTSAARVIAITSRAAMAKNGVLDEISLAVSVERTEQLAGFVIPVRIDDLPFADFRANIARKTAIDCSSAWAKGLLSLLDTLTRDHVPKSVEAGPNYLSAWWESRKTGRKKLVQRAERLISNQFLVKSVPNMIFVLNGTPILGKESIPISLIPLVPFQGSWLSFLSARELNERNVVGLAHHKAAATDEVVSGNVSFVRGLRAAERRRLIHRLLNRQWEYFLLHRGLACYDNPNRPRVMYVPQGLLANDQAEFLDADNVRRRRKLVGFSEKRKVYWHLGLVGRFGGDAAPVMRLKLRVLFTEPGGIVVSTERLRDLRRRFCKNWWNDRWRSLQVAIATWLSNQTATIAVHNGDAGELTLSSQGQEFVSPVAILEYPNTIANVEIDNIDDGIDTDDLDEDVEIEIEGLFEGEGAIP